MPELCAASSPRALPGTLRPGVKLSQALHPAEGEMSAELAGGRRLTLTFQQTHQSQGMHGKFLHRFWDSYLLRTVANIYLQVLTLGRSAQP